MIVLGIDPGTAALGYGIVESTRARSARSTTASRDVAGRVAAGPAAGDPRARRRADRLAPADIVAVERLFFSRNVQTAFGVGPGAWRRAPGGGPARGAGPRGDAERGEVGDRRLWRGRQGPGPADGPDGPRHGRAATARRRRGRPGDRGLGGEHGRFGAGASCRRSSIGPRSRRSARRDRATSVPSARRSPARRPRARAPSARGQAHRRLA